jgi:hypothetical protein
MYSIQFHEDRKCETPEQKAKSMALAIAKAAADENHFSMLMRFTSFPHHWVPFRGPHEEQVRALQQDLMTKSRRHDDYCLMCSCWGNDAHFGGRAHNQKLEMNARLNWLMNEPATTPWRMANQGCRADPATKQVSWESLVAFWGKDLEAFPVRLGERLRATNGILIKSRKSKPAFLEKRVRAATLAWVAYAAGTGKYNTHRGILSQELPIKPARPTDEFWPQTSIYILVVNLSSVLVLDRRSLVICCSSLFCF